MTQAQNQQLLKLTILSPDESFFEGEVQSISCHNPKGSFDILHEHTNFMSMIDTEIRVTEVSGHLRVFPLEQALVKVEDNVVTILVNVPISSSTSGE